MKLHKRFSLLLIATVLSIPLLVAYAAGGRIEGKVTDPKGAAIPGATVTVTNQDTKPGLHRRNRWPGTIQESKVYLPVSTSSRFQQKVSMMAAAKP